MNKKPFYKSKTFWGIILTAVGIYAPKYATFLQGSLDDVITLIGLVTALVGRWTATKGLAVQSPPWQDAIRLILLPLLALPLFSVQASAQEYDKVKITAAYTNLNVANQNLPGANLSVDYKLGRYGKWRLGAVVDGAYQRDTNRALDRYQFLGGPQLSYTVGDDRFSFFGRGMFGATRFDVRQGCAPDFARLTVGVGGGIDVNISEHLGIRALQGDIQYIDERGFRYTRVGAGVFYRF